MKEFIITEENLRWLEQTRDFSRIKAEKLTRCHDCRFFQSIKNSSTGYCTRESKVERKDCDFCSYGDGFLMGSENLEITKSSILEDKQEINPETEKEMRDLNGLEGSIDRISVDEDGNKILTIEFSENNETFFENLSSKNYKFQRNIKEGTIVKIKKNKVFILEDKTKAEKQEIINLQNQLFG